MDLPEKGVKILGVTTDNTSSNDMMVKHLSDLVLYFDGETSQVRCVLHVTNLVAKSLIKLFDLLKKSSMEGDEIESQNSSAESNGSENVEQSAGDDEDDNTEGWVDESGSMTDNEHAELEEHIHLLRMILVKVRKEKKATGVLMEAINADL